MAFVIYSSGIRHPQLRRLLKCLLSMVPALDILSKAFVKMLVIYGSEVRHS